MRFPSRIILTILLAMLPLSAAELPMITLEEALAAAEENSIQLESASVQLGQAMRRQNAVMSTFMPNISLGASVSTSIPLQDIAPTKAGFAGLNYSVNANVTFPFTGSMIKDGETRRIAKEQAALDYQTKYVAFEQDLISAYWGLAAADLSIEAAQISVENARRQYDSTSEMYQKGMIDELSLLQSELALGQMELNLKILEDSKEQLTAAFRESTGIAGDFRTEDLPEPVLLSLPAPEELFAEYSENSLSVQSARNSLESAKNSETSTKLATYVPSISASIGYSYGGAHDRSWNYATRTNGLSGSVSVSIPVSSMIPSSSTGLAIQDLSDAVTLASIALESTNDALLASIRSQTMTIAQAEATLKMAERNLETAERTYSLAEEEYAAGLMSANDLASARSSLLSAQMNILNARLDHLNASYDLAYTINISLDDLRERFAVNEENL